MYKFITGFYMFFLITTANASIIETFDTHADMINLLDRDIISGDSSTHWLGAGYTGFATPSVHFNDYLSANSISLKDNSLSILSFDFSEFQDESTTGNNWTWSFYDAFDILIDTIAYVNTGDSSIQNYNLVDIGLIGVNTVRLEHLNGWMNIDNLEYAPTSVPEPATIWLFGSALAGFAGFRRLKKKA